MTLRRIDIAVVFSLLVHGLIAALPPIHKREMDGGAVAPAFIAQLVDAPKAEITPQPAPVIPTPVPVVKPHPIVAPKIAAAAPAVAIPVERPAPVERIEPHAEPQFDMMAMINARREQRHMTEEAMLQQARARDGASAPDQALAAINRNLSTLTSDRDGTGGVFTILSMGQRTGEFSFNGWHLRGSRHSGGIG